MFCTHVNFLLEIFHELFPSALRLAIRDEPRGARFPFPLRFPVVFPNGEFKFPAVFPAELLDERRQGLGIRGVRFRLSQSSVDEWEIRVGAISHGPIEETVPLRTGKFF